MPDQRNTDVDKIDVAYVAHLARLYLTDEEIGVFQGQLEEIVGYVRKITELDLADVEPTSHVRVMENVFRTDEVRPGLDREQVLAAAPARVGDQFMVPKIVE